MRRNVDTQILELIRLTKEKPFELTMQSLAHELDVAYSTVKSYAKELCLPVRTKRTKYTPEQIEFVRTNAAVMTNGQISRALELKPYQVQDIADKVDITVLVKRKTNTVKTESEFFEHDKSGIW
jgi:Mn-dependent DtxR family transcriptional regulator